MHGRGCVLARAAHTRNIVWNTIAKSRIFYILVSTESKLHDRDNYTRYLQHCWCENSKREKERLEEEENKRYNKETFRSREDSPKFDIQLSYSIGHERFSISRLFERKSGHTCRHNIESTVHLNITSYVNKRVWSPDEHVIFWHVYVHVIRKCNCRTIRMCKFGSDCEYIRDINIFTYFRCI